MKNSLLKNLLFLGAFLAFGFIQAQSITGTVSDANGPLPGANVLLKNSNTGTTTDFDGNYALNDVAANATLVYSYIGYLPKEVPINGQTVINVILQEDLQSLDEVIVVAYGTTTKKDLTGAVGVISGDDLAEFPATTIDQALQGRTAGVQIVSNSGAPGSSVVVNIRGTGSFSNTTPLYIVDGFPTQDISFLSPSNIQSITVLKDASAGALYGVRASNGVVIIETKKGTSGKVTFEVDSYAGYTLEPEFIDVLDAATWANFAVGLTNENNGPGDVNEQLVAYPAWSNPQSLTNIDWQDYAFNNGFNTGTNLAVRGGGENSRVAFTAGMVQQEGTVVGSSYDRYNMGLNAQFDVSEKFRVKADVKYAYSESITKLGQGYFNMVKLLGNVPHLANANDVNAQGGTNGTNLPYDGSGNYGGYPDVTLQTFRGSTNILGNALQNDADNSVNNVLANMSLEYDLFNGLMAKINVGGNLNVFSGANFNPSYYRSQNNVDLSTSAVYDVQNNTFNEILAEGILQYTKEFGNHKIDLLGGISSQRSYFKRIRTRASVFLNNVVRDVAQGADVQAREGYSSRTTLASTFARLNYNFNSKYYITATVRRDGIGDRFGENELWGTFPSFAAGWNIDEEAFMADGLFDVLKLRGSWGETGSNLIEPFQYSVIYSNGSPQDDAGYIFSENQTQGLYPEALPNPDLKWETQVQTNVGLEAELFERRLYLTVDWFKKESSDFLFNETIPVQNGFTSRAVNAGNVVNKGFEFLVGYRKVDGDFTWDITGNLTLLDNEITALTSSQDFVVLNSEFVPSFNSGNFWQGLTRSEVGGEVGAWYAFRADGLFQTQAEVDAANTSANAADSDFDYYQDEDTSPGDRRFKDLNGDGRIDADDREIIGSPIPDFYGGLNLSFSYKNWDLGIDLYGSYGSDIMNFSRVELETAGGYGLSDAFTNISVNYYNNRWTGPGTTNTYARAIGDDGGIQNNRASDYFLESGDFVKLRNLRLGYNLPSTLTEVIGMSAAKIYVSAQNLITWTDYTGWNPEIGQNADINGVNSVQTRGIDAGAYPISTSFTMGVNLQF